MCIRDSFKVRNEYSIGKLLAEIVLSNTAKVSDLKYQIIRPFNISGPRQLKDGGFVLPTFTHQALKGDDITVFGDGEQIRAFTYVKDIVNAGKNVLIGDHVKIGKNCSIGHNSIVERNVQIGDNCKIGSNTILRNSLIKNNVTVLDNCVIGKKGFGFFPNKIKNHRYPHIGIVIINENCEIGCNATIDRGSMSNTEIGKNTFLDNQIHIAHNVKIGENTIIAGQVGIAGSSIIGNNVKIGGQAGISGHLRVGNNVEIGGGSGVIKDIPDNAKVMGYPAKSIREFLKDNR